MPSTTRQVPASAFRFSAGNVAFGQFAAKAGEGKEDAAPQPRSLTITALSGEPVASWYWGRCLHDLSGMQLHKPSLPLDYCHEDDEILGFCDKFDTSGGTLNVGATLVPFSDDDRASEVSYKADNGVPYEASIFFDPRTVKVEELDANQVAMCNGKQVQGPLTIFRHWSLRGVAICPYGQDKQTSSQFREGEQFSISIERNPGAMSTETKPAETKPETIHAVAGDNAGQQAAAPADTAAPVEEAGKQADAPKTPSRKEEGQRFLTAFGEKGAKFFAEGLSFEEAQGKYAADLATENATLRQRLNGGQLAAGAAGGVTPGLMGETSPLSSDPAPTEAAGKQAEFATRYGESFGKFAAGIELPKK